MNFVNAINGLHLAVWGFVLLFFVLRIAALLGSAKFLGNTESISFVSKANAVHSNVWGIVILGFGVILCCCGQPPIGITLISMAGVLLKTSPDAKTDSGPNPQSTTSPKA